MRHPVCHTRVQAHKCAHVHMHRGTCAGGGGGGCACSYTLCTNVATCTVPEADCASVDNHVDVCKHMHVLAAVWVHMAKQGVC